MTLVLIVLNRPRVDALIRGTCPPLLASEHEKFKITRLQTMRANMILLYSGRLAAEVLRRLDQAERIARRLGIGQDGIRAAFGYLFIPGSTGRLLHGPARALRRRRDARPAPAGPATDPAAIRAALAIYLNRTRNPGPNGSRRASRGRRSEQWQWSVVSGEYGPTRQDRGAACDAIRPRRSESSTGSRLRMPTDH